MQQLVGLVLVFLGVLGFNELIKPSCSKRNLNLDLDERKDSEDDPLQRSQQIEIAKV